MATQRGSRGTTYVDLPTYWARTFRLESVPQSSEGRVMQELIIGDDGQLGRVERAIAALEGRAARDQMRMQELLQALHAEQNELRRYVRRRRSRKSQLDAVLPRAA